MPRFQPVLDARRNDACEHCSPKQRQDHTEDYLCQQAMGTDELPIRCVGQWAVDKLTILVKYFNIFASGMHRKWRLNYVEICSGPGRCIVRESGEEINGTALAVARDAAFRYVNRAVFVDYNAAVTDALRERFRRLPAAVSSRLEVVEGDYTNTTTLVPIMRGLAKPGTLTLVCIDPTACDVPFTTVAYLAAALPRVDFIINAAIGTDANRNLGRAFLEPGSVGMRNKYAAFLGEADFFENEELRLAAVAGKASRLQRGFAETYEASLRRIGLTHVARCAVLHYYQLVFASASPRGLDFWQKATRTDPRGQMELFENSEDYG